MKVIVCSSKDVASRNVYSVLKESFVQSTDFFDDNFIYKHDKNSLVLSDKDTVFVDASSLNADLLVFASKHKSEKSVPMFSVHSTGVFSSDITHGGSPYSLSAVDARVNSFALREFKRLKIPGFEVGFEVTHHGPVSSKPIVFVEVGGTLKEWNNRKACNIVAKVCMSLLNSEINSVLPVGIGFGGPHYAPKFTKLVLNNDYDLGHICPKYFVKNLSFDLVKQMVEMTFPRPSFGLIEKNNCSRRSTIKEWLNDLNVEPVLV